MITDKQLIALAGKGAFGRGKDYFTSGAVIEWNKKGTTITALVAGSETYAVTLRHTSRNFDGSCDCPASDGFDFCKHCVAVALAYRQESSEQSKLESGKPIERIQAYLNKLDKSQLQGELIALMEHDRVLREQWSLRADLALNKIDAKAIKKRITAALPYNRNYYRYAQVRSYFAQAEPAIDLLEKQAPNLEANKALELVDYGLQRLNKALETIDDSGGFRLDIEETLQALHIVTLARTGWDNEQLVSYLESVEDSDCSDFYPAIPDAYYDLLGEEGLRLYVQHKQAIWDALPPLPPQADWDKKSPYLRLSHLLIAHAQATDDTAAEIVLLEKMATEVRDCVGLCERLIALDLWPQVDMWLSKAKQWQKKSSPRSTMYDRNVDIERVELKLFLHKGDLAAALQKQWEIYQVQSGINNYKQLLDLAEQCGERKRWHDKVFSILHDNVEKSKENYSLIRQLDHLIDLYLHENKPDNALTLVNKFKISQESLYAVINAFYKQPTITMPLYQRLVEVNIRQANNDAYKQGIIFFMECRNSLQNQAHKQAFTLMEEELRTRHKAKRNFIKYLNEAMN